MKTKSLMAQDNCDECADKAINTMVAGAAGLAIIPAQVNWALYAGALGAGVIAIGLSYDVKLTKDEAWKLVKQFFLAAGFGFLAANLGAKFMAAALTTTGIGHVGAVALDASISGGTAYAIGGAAKAYFKGERNKDKLGQIMREHFSKAKSDPNIRKPDVL
ncbi:MAG: hypothetical protein ACXWT1_18330 [Methylobacter sp.]